ncbi:MAG TPA: V-type ATPase 116kDa subunit family protein [Geobacteraceae bacterium]
MSKIEIITQKELLLGVLDLVRETGVFQVEPDLGSFVAPGETSMFRSHLLDKESLRERLFLEELRRQIEEVVACLPPLAVRQSYLEPQSALTAVAALVEKHCQLCRELCQRRDALSQERDSLERQAMVLDALALLVKGVKGNSRLEFIGLTINEPAAMEQLLRLLASLTGDSYEIVTSTAADGTTVALVTLPRAMAGKVRAVLTSERVPEISIPASLQGLPFPEQLRRMKERIGEVADDLARLRHDLQQFAAQWAPTYRLVQEWLDDRLALLNTTTAVHETAMCSIIHGWLPTPDLANLRARLNDTFGGRVVVEEKQVLEEDLAKIPVVLRNPAYFRPFELFSRLLPLPFYTSYDPTPFIGIFFPIFFGMILGDVGYGLVILLAALMVRQLAGQRRNLYDGAMIIMVAACYAIAFGLVFGEFFGGRGPAWLHLEQFGIVERRRSVLPMLFFAVAVGVAHVTLGLLLGAWAALRQREVKEGLFKLLNVLVILCLAALGVAMLLPFPQQVTKSINLAIIVAIPLMLLTGGLLAPLEMLKNIGNIISYARIMAIGLASALIAYVANRLAGLMGDIVLGIVAASLLHLINLVLGVFSPTIHALRLHYVEFFGKFMVYGGRKFEPFKPAGGHSRRRGA